LCRLGASRRTLNQPLDQNKEVELSVSLIIENYSSLNQHIHLKSDLQRVPTIGDTNNLPHMDVDIFDDDEIEKALANIPLRSIDPLEKSQCLQFTSPAKRKIEELITPKSLKNSPTKRRRDENYKSKAESPKSPIRIPGAIDSIICKHQCKDKLRYETHHFTSTTLTDASTNVVKQNLIWHKTN
jgi:hypothetical protein